MDLLSHHRFIKLAPIVDLNNDNQMDIVVANTNDQTIGVLFRDFYRVVKHRMRLVTGNGSSQQALLRHSLH